MLAVIHLNDPGQGAGPGEIIELTEDKPQDILKRYEDRDGARPEWLRIWRASPTMRVGDQVSLVAPVRDRDAADREYEQDQRWLTSDSVLTTTQERIAQVKAFVLDRRAHAAKATALAQAVERDEGPIRLAHDKDRSHVVRELRAEAALADAVASGIESALSILF